MTDDLKFSDCRSWNSLNYHDSISSVNFNDFDNFDEFNDC